MSRNLASLAVRSFLALLLGGVMPEVVQEPVVPTPELDLEKGEAGRDVAKGLEVPTAVAKAERALRAIQARAAGDGAFKNLAGAPILRGKNLDRITLILACRTEEEFLIPTRGEAASTKGRGSFGVHVVFDDNLPEDSLGETQSGSVIWKTNVPRTFVKLTWCSADLNSPDRLLAIVREALGREGVTLIPVQEIEWPYATAAERLSQLLPIGGQPIGPARTEIAATGFKPEVIFASPSAVAETFHNAQAKNDWKTIILCLTPASRGAHFREVLSLTSSLQLREVARLIEASLKCDIFDDECRLLTSKEVEALLVAPGEPSEKLDEVADARLYGSLRKRIDDVPQLLADCLRQASGPPQAGPPVLDFKGFRIEGDKASGYLVRTQPIPTPEEVERHGAISYLPDHIPVRLRKINGSWLVAIEFDPGD